MNCFRYVSATSDGSMKVVATDPEIVKQNRYAFLTEHSIKPEDTTWLRLEYGGTNYCRYASLDASYKGDGITRKSTIDVDALVATKAQHAILLPLADCIGAVLYDPTQNVLMLSHLGRHNLEQYGGTESVKYLIEHHNVLPKNLEVWLSPAASKENYPLHAFNGQGMHEVATKQLVAAGVAKKNIDVSPIDTTRDETYFSHSEFLKGNRPTDGRFCVVAVMR